MCRLLELPLPAPSQDAVAVMRNGDASPVAMVVCSFILGVTGHRFAPLAAS